jgi:phosphoglucomutase / phosphopentomutase
MKRATCSTLICPLQIISPNDKSIAKAILENLSLDAAAWDVSQVRRTWCHVSQMLTPRLRAQVRSHHLCVDPLPVCMAEYFEHIKAFCYHRFDCPISVRVHIRSCRAVHREQNAASDLKIVYTPMHGVGLRFAAASFAAFSLPPFIPVALQAGPDPDFPTVKYPNPEEGKSALVCVCVCACVCACFVIV